MSTKRSTIFFLTLTAAWAGCGRQEPAAPESSLAATVETPLPSGVYARQLRLVSESTFLWMKSQNVLERVQLVTIKANGTKVTGTAVTCAVNSLSSGPDKLSMPEAFVKSLPKDTFTYTLTRQANGWLLKGNKRTDLIGAKLGQIETEEMPKSASEASVIDQDRDGHPGMSVNVKVDMLRMTGQIYIAARVSLAETATLLNPAKIDGALSWQGQQVVLGGSNRFLATSNPTTRSLPERSTFALRKLPDNATCATVVAQRQQLFGPLRL